MNPAPSPSASAFSEFSKKYSPLVDALMENFFMEKINGADHPFIRDMYAALSEYSMRDGKRIRPLLLLASYEGYKKGIRRRAEIMKLACAVELMHSFLLIQDDIIDRSPLRRGGKSLHVVLDEMFYGKTHNKRIGSDLGIVLADVLFANAMQLISSAGIGSREKDEFIRIFSRTYEMTAWGQILDITHSREKRPDLSGDWPLVISELKTAHYTIYYPLVMGYVLSGGRDDREIAAIREFSLPLGIAFQMRDDILGTFGSEKQLGKSNDSDLSEGKMTLLIKYTLDFLEGDERKKFLSLFTSKSKTKSDISGMRSMIRNSGALRMVRARHLEQVESSVSLLRRLRLSGGMKLAVEGMIEGISAINA
ncbi:MAG: polyprenyl synthetase family protein [Spirochaetes bacterium]|jgi:geranylgeranyl diphosphate synthase type I|nr:polyprenyl synthetase family protein [Spirochaetota bacterium]